MSAWLLLVLAQAASASPSVDGGVEPSPGPRLDLGSGFSVRPLADLLAEFNAQATQDGTSGDWFDEFRLPRAQLGGELAWQGATARLVLEGVRASSGGALVGVAGNSVVIRAREVSVGYRLGDFEAAAGMVPTLEVPLLERAFAYRAVGPVALEATSVQSPADLGVRLKWRAPRGYGEVNLAAFNGDGYTSPELNRGKTVAALVAAHPLAGGRFSPLTLVLSGSLGQTGTARAPANRLGGGVWWATPRFAAGATAWYADGLLDDGGRRALVAEVFARGELFGRLLLSARASLFHRDLSVSDDRLYDLQLSAGVRVISAVELFAVFERSAPSAATRLALPGSDATAFRVTARFHLPDVAPEDLP
jgi:hypothetical protein